MEVEKQIDNEIGKKVIQWKHSQIVNTENSGYSDFNSNCLACDNIILPKWELKRQKILIKGEKLVQKPIFGLRRLVNLS